jgi:hypothetical protein
MTATPATHGDGGGSGVLAGHPQDMVDAFGGNATLQEFLGTTVFAPPQTFKQNRNFTNEPNTYY